MWNSLRVAASGMHAQQRKLDVVANNLANQNTTGYKGRRANIVDQPPEEAVFAVPTERGGEPRLERRVVGQGSQVDSILADLTAGPIRPTGRSLDVAIAGEGFLPVIAPDGRPAYTRDGALRIDAAGLLVTSTGVPVGEGIVVPAEATDVTIAEDGTIVAYLRADDGTPLEEVIGQLQLVRFTNPDGLESVGGGLFVETARTGAAVYGTPGQDGFAALATGSLEGSNVDMTEEMTRVLHAQRAYQINLRAMQTADQMLQGANNLRR